jgi:4-hydroxybenzoate polyprenyltransferase
VGVVAIAGLLLYEHRLVRPDDLNRVNVAFFNVNAVISFGILVLGCLDIWLF